MRRLVRNTVLFTLTTVAVYLLLLFALGDWGWVRTARTEMGNRGFLNSRVKDIRNYHNVDVLFLGSSHSYRTFDTRFYRAQGLSCFNLGSSNQTPIQTYVLLKTYLDSLNPKFVVFEVHPDIMKNDGVECAVDLLINTPVTWEATKMAWHTGNMKVINTWLYSLYNQKIRHRLEHFVEDSVMDDAEYVAGGYVEINTKEFVRKRYSAHNLTIRPEQMEALKRCLGLLKERGIPYMLVEVQDAYQLRSAFKNHEWFEDKMKALGPYRYKILPLVDTVHFCNSNHLFKPGIELFNQDFIVDLKQALADNGILLTSSQTQTNSFTN